MFKERYFLLTSKKLNFSDSVYASVGADGYLKLYDLKA